jgi:hypothetical protein
MQLLELVAAVECMTRLEAVECQIQLPTRTHQPGVTQTGAIHCRAWPCLPSSSGSVVASYLPLLLTVVHPVCLGPGPFHLGESGPRVMPGRVPGE